MRVHLIQNKLFDFKGGAKKKLYEGGVEKWQQTLTHNGPITRILRYWLASLKDQSRKIFVIDTYFRYWPLLGNNGIATGSLHVGLNCKWWKKLEC